MKKILILLNAVVLFAASLSFNDEFKKGNYEQSFHLAKELCKIDCNDENLNLVLAISADKLNKDDEALAAFNRVLILNEDNIKARLYLANLYFKNQNYEFLYDEIEYLKAHLNNLNQEQKQQLQNMINKLNSNFSLAFSTSITYENNPLFSNDKTITIYNEKKEAQQFKNTKENGSFSNITKLNLEYENEYFISDFSVNNKVYFKKAYPNTSTFNFGIGKNIQDFSFRLAYEYNFLQSSSLYQDFDLNIMYYKNLSDLYSLLLSYDFAKGYFFGLKDENYNEHNFVIANILSLNEHTYYFNLLFDTQKAKDSINSNYNKYSFEFIYSRILSNNFDFNASALISKVIYKDENLSFLSKRKDTIFQVDSSLIYKINKEHSLELNVNYQTQSSNQNIFDSNNLLSSLIYKYKF
ncbi:tetratricopeptide repeat protein [Campylobacter canadensis]|uniref:tetratricopeptide repeat protein n=1 Tax=Campylobacter canadensis TaxID=449520 RepID=UPI0015526EFF|nr:tetratricopeptide repeat protein [Campylobacter canadensis]MBZ7994600.1 tetratricopeptide repeat protein [Campylobacter canadensis]